MLETQPTRPTASMVPSEQFAEAQALLARRTRYLPRRVTAQVMSDEVDLSWSPTTSSPRICKASSGRHPPRRLLAEQMLRPAGHTATRHLRTDSSGQRRCPTKGSAPSTSACAKRTSRRPGWCCRAAGWPQARAPSPLAHRRVDPGDLIGERDRQCGALQTCVSTRSGRPAGRRCGRQGVRERSI